MNGLPVDVFALAGSALVAAVWEGCVLAAAVALALRLLPEMPARARSVVWTVVLMLVVGLPFLHGARGGSATANPVRVGLGWTLGLAAVWVTASVVRAVRLIVSAVTLRGVAGRAKGLAVSLEIAALVDGRAQVCVSDEVSVPSVVGFFAPRILIPEAIAGTISERDLRQIVVHECEHLRRRDDWVNLVQKLSLVVFPLNPALIWVERRLCAEREMACDDAVVKATGSAKAYASCLATLAEHTLVRRGVSLALGAWERRPELARRVARILARPQGEVRGARAVVAAMLVGVVAGGGALSRSPRIVQFAGRVPVVAGVDRVEGPAGFTPVATQAGMGKVVLASMKMPEAQKTVKASVRRKRRVARSVPVAAPPRMISQTETTVMRGADGTTIARRVVFTYDPAQQASYAAVPTRNGWLIFQL